MFELKVVTDFAAAHQLPMPGRECENLHGHNWKIEVFLGGEELDDQGVLIDFAIVKKNLAVILGELDHKYLNDLPAFQGCPPSSENIAKHIANRLARCTELEPARVLRVTAWESNDACATYLM